MSGALWGLVGLTVGLVCGWMVSAMIIMGSIADEREKMMRMRDVLRRIVKLSNETRLDMELELLNECEELLREDQ